MVEESIRELIESLKQQEKMYRKMQHLACQQLEAARDPAGSEVDGDLILKQKAKLVEDLQLVAARSRLIESELVARFGMLEFTLSGINGKVDDELCRLLVKAFDGLSGVLKDIAELDAETIRLMSSRLTVYQHPRQRPPNAAQALQAYRDGTGTKKD